MSLTNVIAQKIKEKLASLVNLECPECSSTDVKIKMPGRVYFPHPVKTILSLGRDKPREEYHCSFCNYNWEN